MSIYQVKTISFSVYGDSSSTQWSVDLSDYVPTGFSILSVYSISEVNVPYWGNYLELTNLTYTLNNSILTVTLPVAPSTWTPTYINPGYVPNPSTPPTETVTPPSVSFNVTVSY